MKLKTVAAVLALAATTGFAEASGYIGATIGQSEVDVSGFDKASGLQLYGGVNLSENLAFEIALTDLGEFNVSGASDTYIDVGGVELTAIGSMPLSDNISLFIEGGFFSWTMDAVLFGTKIGEDDGSDLTYGVGMDVNITDSLGLMIQYQKYTNVSDSDIDTMRAGVSFTF